MANNIPAGDFPRVWPTADNRLLELERIVSEQSVLIHQLRDELHSLREEHGGQLDQLYDWAEEDGHG